MNMEQRDLFGNVIPPLTNDKVKSGLKKIENGEYLLYPDFFSKKESNLYLQNLKENIDWKQESMNMYGKQVNFPRLTAWYGDNNKPYSFSGITLAPKVWTKEILEIKDKIEPLSKVQFNSVLLNRYRNGNDSISWHTDAEKELGINPIIASVNFGATRKFQLRHIKTKEKLEIELTHGSLLIMQGELQHFWQHQVPKTSKIVNERINLTFRVIKL
jgi:alkylated DNA repair dioxygenase AlkB